MQPYDLIKKPVVSEKTFGRLEDNQYTFEVDKDANKIEIKKAIEEIFKVKVDKVRIINVKGKPTRFRMIRSRRRNWKKAIVKLKEGYKIELFEGM